MWVRIILEENGVREQHDVLIEDKVYSKLRDKQLSDIRSVFDKYLDEEQIIAERHYILLTCMESYDANINQYSKASDDGFTLILWDELMVLCLQAENQCSQKVKYLMSFGLRAGIRTSTTTNVNI